MVRGDDAADLKAIRKALVAQGWTIRARSPCTRRHRHRWRAWRPVRSTYGTPGSASPRLGRVARAGPVAWAEPECPRAPAGDEGSPLDQLRELYARHRTPVHEEALLDQLLTDLTEARGVAQALS